MVEGCRRSRWSTRVVLWPAESVTSPTDLGCLIRRHKQDIPRFASKVQNLHLEEVSTVRGSNCV